MLVGGLIISVKVSHELLLIPPTISLKFPLIKTFVSLKIDFWKLLMVKKLLRELNCLVGIPRSIHRHLGLFTHLSGRQPHTDGQSFQKNWKIWRRKNKNCECCSVSLNCQVTKTVTNPSCQHWNQCLKCHNSLCLELELSRVGIVRKDWQRHKGPMV